MYDPRITVEWVNLLNLHGHSLVVTALPSIRAKHELQVCAAGPNTQFDLSENGRVFVGNIVESDNSPHRRAIQNFIAIGIVYRPCPFLDTNLLCCLSHDENLFQSKLEDSQLSRVQQERAHVKGKIIKR